LVSVADMAVKGSSC